MKKYGLLILTSLITALLVGLSGIYYISQDINKIILSEIKQHHKISEFRLKEFKDEESQFVNFIGEYSQCFKYDQNKTNILNDYLSFVKIKPNIMQLRFLNLNGDEVLRIDRDRNNNIYIINGSDLQNKSNRYYFKKFINLKKDEIGYSNFDLNVENSKIQKPFNPTLRIGKKVYKDGHPIGLVVVNYYMNNWLNYYIENSTANVSLIDQDGYFLMHHKPEWSWSRYIEKPKKIIDYLKLKQDFKLNKNKELYILTNNAFGYSIDFFDKNILVLYEPKISISDIILDKIITFSTILILIAIILVTPLVLIIYQNFKKLQDLNIKNIEHSRYLTSVFNSTFEALLITDEKGIVQNINTKAIELFGYKQEELSGQNIKVLVPQPHRSKHDDYIKNIGDFKKLVLNKQRRIFGIHKNNTKIPISVAITKMKIGSQVHFIASVKDLQEMLELENNQKQQEKALIQQSKLASMGEMIGAIAHQWRQPLNELSIRIQKLKYNYEKDEIDAKFISNFIQKNKNTIDFMSKTIDDFRNFFRIDKEKKEFYVREAIDEVLNIQGAQLKNHGILVEIRGDDFNFNGHRSEFQQVILNIISNSKDAFISNNIKDPKIDITLDKNTIFIQDNAGGIQDEIIDRVFEPYFTTKEQGEGTGMGLYMSKMIIEQNMQGNINIKNKIDGSEVSIKLKRELS